MNGIEYRCWCGHFEAEHTFSGGCAGCDAGGKPTDIIEHNYEADPEWPERDPIEVYGTIEHEAWLIEMERQEP